MKIFKAYESGFRRSLNAWKGVVIVWFFSLLSVSLVALPMKGAIKAAFGKSMVTDKLMGGLDVEVLVDLGASLRILTHFFSSGLFFLILAGFLANSFLAGGLFDTLKKSDNRISAAEFFRASAGNFWSFLGISSIISIIIIIIGFLVVGLPAGFISNLHADSEKTPYIIVLISILVFFTIVAILNLVADYARSWQVTKEKKSCFKALGFGFNRTFRTFFPSFLMMFIIMIVLVLFNLLVLKILGPWRPVTGAGVLLLFIVSQLLFFVKVLIKTWRYGSVTSLMEQSNPDDNLV
ncbi:MAG: hypothetical protein MUC93_02550 [Bacteroidales bacterium]|jgi:hypothetical protein|nr:hypothetical protein [Bacteroidales bacterium]